MKSSPLLRGLIWAIIPLASFLSFSIQPLIGKLLLPAFGGSAATWLGVMLYFQILLLAGYGFAHKLLKRTAKVQAFTISALAAISLFFIRLDSTQTASPTIVSILGLLAIRTAPAVLLLFSLSPLLHAWMRAGELRVPYVLYGISNAGSLGGLLLYPFIIERSMGLQTQILYWKVMFCIVVILSLTCSFVFFRSKNSNSVTQESSETISWYKKLCWVGLAALTCVNMLSATQYISGEIGSTPLTWVGPFGLYLLSFIVIFAGFWRTSLSRIATGILAASLLLYISAKGMTAATVSGHTLHALLLVTAASSFLGNSLLYSLRPSRAFSIYYLYLAVGGVVGGLLSSTILPATLNQPFEFIISSTLLVGVGAVLYASGNSTGSKLLTTFVATFAFCFLFWKQVFPEEQPNNKFQYRRNVYGFSTLNITENGVILSNETTTHGSQITKTPEGRRQPTMYYSESTAIGVTFEHMRESRRTLTVGVVGLGAGTLASYLRPEDNIHFWEIDPKAINIATHAFSFIPDALGRVSIHMQDGRKGIQASKIDFDILVIDAFAGDSIPAHLVTQEALEIYRGRLRKNDGVLLVHASNRYSVLYPIISATARSIQQTAIDVNTEILESTPTRDYDKTTTQYIVIVEPDRASSIASWFPLEEDNGRVRRRVTVDHIAVDDGKDAACWTDDRSSILDTLDLKKFWQ